MPLFTRDPTGRLGRKTQHRLADFIARKDAVAGAEHLLQLRITNTLSPFRLDYLRTLNSINSETAKTIAQVAPAIEIPVVAVMSQTLRRYGTLGDLAAASVEMPDLQSVTT